MSTDPDRWAAYAAEDRLAAWLDTLTPERAEITVDGRTFRPETEPRFTDPDAAGRYVDRVLAHLRERGKQYGGREAVPVAVRPRRGNRAATYSLSTATIAVPPFERGGRWALRGLVVLHEIAHHLHGEDGHGPAWRGTFVRLLEDIGSPVTAELLQHAYAEEGLGQVTHSVDDGTLARIAKLLRQAEGTHNEHEREAFLAKAQGMATKASIALALARAHTARQERRDQPVAESYRIGEPGKRGLARYVRLLLNVAHTNDLRCTISHDSTAVTLYGFAADIEVTKALYESLLVQMVTDCERFLASGKREVVRSWNARRRRWETKPVATITARLAFYEAYAMRIHQRLDAARKAEIAAASAQERASTASDATSPASAPTSSETALALREKELAVHDYFADALRRNRVRGSWKGDRRSSIDAAPAAAGEGHRAAGRARLTDDPARGRQLGPAG
ncbi:TIGR04338 family metallohydrolase [Nocardioides sp. GY 10113]|uniref:TIGR04338 family metallohydrolase n=1 Tax=Nocardioides sp. GY 10113 TaxID=2569761 RepID=UPI0010A76355|nr:TIGR04338 family metallohydrolase [Nocardioides sp. GY 10113]TIC87471.1 TIGR04338 family metallohydrolase [Nocardioides sp. GY 10113]